MQLKLRETPGLDSKGGIIEILEQRRITCAARVGYVSYHNADEEAFIKNSLLGSEVQSGVQRQEVSPFQIKAQVYEDSSQSGVIVLTMDKSSAIQPVIGFITYLDSDRRDFYLKALGIKA